MIRSTESWIISTVRSTGDRSRCRAADAQDLAEAPAGPRRLVLTAHKVHVTVRLAIHQSRCDSDRLFFAELLGIADKLSGSVPCF
jgi:hypothetical protein